MQKLAIGSVQFGIPYGINNTIGVPHKEEVRAILELAKRVGIDLIDTASVYGDAEKVLGENDLLAFRVVSKFSKCENRPDFANQLETTLHRLNVESIYGFMAHNANELIEKNWLWDALKESKATGKIQKIGYSLYTPEQLEIVLDKQMVPEIVQLPFSILDRKFESYLALLKGLGVEIHVRSVFLQGLYFMNPDQLPIKLQPLKSVLKKLMDCCNRYETPIRSVALNFAVDHLMIDKVVVGVESVNQLEENILAIEQRENMKTLYNEIREIEVENSNLLNPSNW